jgi:hypothetical protein
VWSPVWSENEHSRSAQDGWGQEENHGWGYGDIVFRETSKLYSTEMNNKSVQKKVAAWETINYLSTECITHKSEPKSENLNEISEIF